MRKWNDDPFTKKARREHYEARSIYKLQEVQEREGLLDKAQAILDLGASPGSWVQYCLKHSATATVFAVDLSAINVQHDRLHFLQADIAAADIAQLIAPNAAVDVVLSDMAPKTTGVRAIDIERSTELVRLALHTADRYLRNGGNLVVKLFMGDTFSEIESQFKSRFEKTRILKPLSTRRQSKEIYIIGKGKTAR